MSSDWILDPDSETGHILPWLAQEPNPDTRERVLRYIADIVRAPIGRGREDAGVFSALVPGTGTALIWLLDHVRKIVVLAHIGRTEQTRD